MKPYYERGGITLFHGDMRDVVPHLTERGVRIQDSPYSEHTHNNSRSRWSKLTGNPAAGTATAKANASRVVSFGFGHLVASLRRFIARESKRLVSTWAIDFSDTESDHLWRRSMTAAGLQYCRTGLWRKIGGTPQFTGDRPAVAVEALTICHQPGRKRWNGGGKHGWWETRLDDEGEDFDAFHRWGSDLVYDVPIALERGDGSEARRHTTQKPVRLMLELVEDFTNPGDLVYDWSAGFGTIGIACLRAAGGPRRCVMIELQEKWCEAAAKRVDAEFTGSGFLAAEQGQIGLFSAPSGFLVAP